MEFIKYFKIMGLILLATLFVCLIGYIEFKLEVPASIVFIPNLILGSATGIFIFIKCIDIYEA